MLIINDWWKIKRKETKKMVGERFKHSSSMQTTDIKKIVLNSGVGQTIENKQLLDNTKEALAKIARGQRPILTYARDSIINFKLREGMPIGCKVTLRKNKIWDFLFELININLPQITNFKGFLLDKFDRNGNYNLGLDNLNIFPSIPYDLTFKNQGIQIAVVFKSNYIKENAYFMSLLGFPFKERQKLLEEKSITIAND
ncbi:large ribosomal subunit protein uL5 [endosymbiont GvMRE of Glomus versiforme]|uniref:large ribosomal subunit protein uL5 n=1 Tax=endosymbiont GvMRE of Glomus versiforme TaxID=2039283 RepID=UPI000EB880B2|nr:50S ribosomal protein L5 [endosymbiont GvMRE of Glomus versiforme]RHZ35468.1 50S ribosomal protein L5 [endosymbiont GvMRE of Glomus versiforme]